MTRDKKTAGSIFTDGSIACHGALEQLSVAFARVGFIVEKKRAHESTLRVYVRKRLTYPLLNPRFRRESGRPIVEITALSKGDEVLHHRLMSFPRSSRAVFKAVASREGTYFNHGYFAVPFAPRTIGVSLNWSVTALEHALAEILKHLD